MEFNFRKSGTKKKKPARSERVQVVLEKNGFLLEETRAGAVVKGGKAMDVRVYRLASDQASLHDF